MKASLLVHIVDLIMVNALYALFSMVLGWTPSEPYCWFLWNLCYGCGVLYYRPFAQLRASRVDIILKRVAQTVLLIMFIYGLFIWFDNRCNVSLFHFCLLTVCLYVFVVSGRLLCRAKLKQVRRGGRNNERIVFVGAGHNLAYLYQCLMSDLANGYRVLGYFEDVDSKHLPKEVVRIGQINEVIDWLENNQVDKLFCNLPDSRSVEIIAIINYCESHLIHFYSVPNVRNYVHRAMEVEMMDNMPVLKLRREPLNSPYNQIVKRFLDILISSVFIITCFWWIYIIVAIITKITMPGPVLFKQKRNGLLGEEFTCLKFRSMKVNRDADRLQATKDDPRKTKWGNIMRSTSIDELPQFLNVLMGDMSVVGPRPHMVKHTEEYSELIEKYMVRHWVKPGITGWAQVNGARGETQELWQMEDRIKKDIWYVENWSIWLDIRIMIKTLKNAICGDKQAY